uniref:Uncharacterized protein n=1 Tax=Arundo donax TaxID=35708 RepID=A0A0A9DV98_ARUDO
MRFMPEHNWSAYKEDPKEKPVLAKMMISGVIYSLGAWMAQVIPQFHFHGSSRSIHLPVVVIMRSLQVLYLQCYGGKANI